METVNVLGEPVQVRDAVVYEYRSKAFELAKPYLDLISDKTMRRFAESLWIYAPMYFFISPSSSSGKYHAEWSTSLGGLVRHVLTGVQAAYDLSQTFGLTDAETDEALVAVFGHDCLKYGIDYDTRYMDMHPFLPRSFYGHWDSIGFLGEGFIEQEIGVDRFDRVMSAIERHMGSIDSGAWTSVARVMPDTKMEQVVHLADYMSSRGKLVHVNFVKGYNIGGVGDV